MPDTFHAQLAFTDIISYIQGCIALRDKKHLHALTIGNVFLFFRCRKLSEHIKILNRLFGDYKQSDQITIGVDEDIRVLMVFNITTHQFTKIKYPKTAI
jgi:hypothetical protein